MRVGTVCYATDQGIAHLARDFWRAGLITDVLVFRHGRRPTHLGWYEKSGDDPFVTKNDTSQRYWGELVGRPFNGPAVDAMLAAVDVMLFFETPFDWGFLDYCRRRGVRTAIVPMYECTPVSRPFEPDLWVCPSKLDQEYFPGSPRVPIPVPHGITWTARTAPATRFIHNAGNLGLREHKGTRQLLEAMRLVTKPVRLFVRAQDTEAMARLLSSFPEYSRSRNTTLAEVQYKPGATVGVYNRPADYGVLFSDGEVYVAPEKYNGLSLPLIEAFASGLCVCTTDRFPHNDWLPTEPLIPVKSYARARASGGCNEYDEAVVDPADVARTLDRLYGRDVSRHSELGRKFGEAHSWEKLRPVWKDVLS
jgi:hypothetical protein